jgi:hypothetical protein
MKILYILLIIVIFFYLKKSKENFESVENKGFFNNIINKIKNIINITNSKENINSEIKIKEILQSRLLPKLNDNEPITTDRANTIVNGYDQTKTNYQNTLKTDIVYKDIDTNINIKNAKFPNEIIDDNKNFDLLGIAYNVYYNMYYLIYHHQLEDIIDIKGINKKDFTDDMNKEIEITNDFNSIYEDIYVKPPLIPVNETKYLINHLHEYRLVKMEDKVPKIMHKVGPRKKINLNDIVYFSYGAFELGPLVIKKITPQSNNLQ